MGKSKLFSLLAASLAALSLSACGGSQPTATPIPTRPVTASAVPPSPTLDRTRTTVTPFGAFVTVTPFTVDQPTFSVPTLAPPIPRPGETIPPTIPPAPFMTVTPFPTAGPGDSGLLPTSTLRALTLRPGESAPSNATPIPFQTVTPPPIEIGTRNPAQLTQTAAAPINSNAAPTLDFSVPPPPPNTTALFPEGCSAFTLDKADSKLFVLVKTDGLLAWGNVPEATGYHIWLRHPDGTFILNQQVQTNRLPISSSIDGRVIFNVPGVFAFEIVAYRGTEPICNHVTDIIIVSQ